MFDKKNSVGLALVIILIACFASVFILYKEFLKVYDNEKIKKQLISEIDGKFTRIGDYQKSGLLKSKEPEVVLTKFDTIKPIYSMINNNEIVDYPYHNKSQSKTFEVIIFYLERENIFESEFKIINYLSVKISNKNIFELRELTKKYNLAVDVPENVEVVKNTVYSDEFLTSVEESTKLKIDYLKFDDESSFKNEQEKQTIINYHLDRLSDQEKIDVLVDSLNNYKSDLAKFDSGEFPPDHKVCRYGYCLSRTDVAISIERIPNWIKIFQDNIDESN